MTGRVLIDTGVLNELLNPQSDDSSRDCYLWFETLRRGRYDIKVPLICFYEVRRGLVRTARNPKKSPMERERFRQTIDDLQALCASLGLLPIDRKTMMIASELWADARLSGKPSDDDTSLDADVIIDATARRWGRGEHEVVIITNNVNHLQTYANLNVQVRT